MSSSAPFNLSAIELSAKRGYTQTEQEHQIPHEFESGVSWGAIFAGAVTSASLSLIMLILGAGLGLFSVSPWVDEGIRGATFGVSSIVWITFTQLVASGMGGYLAGRLRVKWLWIHTDEVFFRDTAHGFLAWAVASLATAVLLTSVIGSILGGGIRAGSAVIGGVSTVAATAVGAVASDAGAPVGASSTGLDSGRLSYFVDSLFRKETLVSTPSLSSGNETATVSGASHMPPNAAATLSEVTGIFVNSIRRGEFMPADSKYVAQIIASRTNISQAEAEKRVNQSFARLQEAIVATETASKEATDRARKASAYAALWLFVSLLCGAFFASFAATFGGRQRDN